MHQREEIPQQTEQHTLKRRKDEHGNVIAGEQSLAAFAVNGSDWLHGGSASAGKFCVSAVFIVLVSLLLYEWRKSNTAMCLLTIASALIAIGAAAGLLMTTDILPANSVLLPFIVFLVPFFGVRQSNFSDNRDFVFIDEDTIYVSATPDWMEFKVITDSDV